MILLHSEHSELSRTLLRTAPENTVVLQAGEHDYLISAYPSVVIIREAAEYQMPFYGP